MKRKHLIVGSVGTLLTVVTAFQFDRLRYEEPAYETVAVFDDLEIRRYGSRVVAETLVTGRGADATSEGFRRLAGYIFGGNDGGRSIAMTTPVSTRAEGSRIAMTTPVTTRAESDGRWVTFTMPSDRPLGSLPRPNDARVRLREVPGDLVAVLRFRGRAKADSTGHRGSDLAARVARHGYRATGEPTLAQYDPPWVLGPFRRNELQMPVEHL